MCKQTFIQSGYVFEHVAGRILFRNMNDPSYLVTVHCFKGKDYLVKMNIQNRSLLEIKITDKTTSEDWHCSYDATYIENLTHKTGNYKQFDIFITMLKSGLLKTSESISLDLLSFDDLEALRTRRIMGQTFQSHTSNVIPASASNRRYLILTYTVEFDRIHYPLPMEYCGLPDPHVLQATIRRLQQEVIQLQEQLKFVDNPSCDEDLLDQINILQRRVVELTSENELLREDIVKLNNQLNKKRPSANQVDVLNRALMNLEEQVNKERSQSHHKLKCLKEEKLQLMNQLEDFKDIEKNLRTQLRKVLSRNSCQNCFLRASRINPFRKPSPSRSVGDQHTCIKILQDNPISNGIKKRNNKRSPLPMSKSDFPLMQNTNRRSSSASSVDKCHSRHQSCSSHRSSSNESLHSETNRNKGIKSKLKQKKILIDHSSSESSSTIPNTSRKKNCSRNSLKASRLNKDTPNEVRINDLEKRISNLQQILESDLTVNSKNKH